MNSVKAGSAIKAYGKAGAQAGVEFATPHRLITMLLDGALDKISVAKGFMQRKEIENKGNYISWAISIIEGLRVSLDAEKGGEIATNLEGLYLYMQKRLLEANMYNSEEALDEVSGLIKQIREAWINISPDIQNSQNAPTT